MVKLNTEGHVGLVHGDAQEILPGIICHTGGKHTHQSQYVGVNTAGGTVILASDNMYLYENMEKHTPIGETVDAVEFAGAGSDEDAGNAARVGDPGTRYGRIREVSEGGGGSGEDTVIRGLPSRIENRR